MNRKGKIFYFWQKNNWEEKAKDEKVRRIGAVYPTALCRPACSRAEAGQIVRRGTRHHARRDNQFLGKPLERIRTGVRNRLPVCHGAQCLTQLSPHGRTRSRTLRPAGDAGKRRAGSVSPARGGGNQPHAAHRHRHPARTKRTHSPPRAVGV